MEMRTYSKKEIHSRMQKIHDEIKRHPFRIGFEAKYIPGYKHLLYELSEAWSDLVWRCEEKTEEESRLFYQFGRCWIHDYRQELRTYQKDTFPTNLFPYYEQMLQVTHRYLDTGEFDICYNPDVFQDASGNRYRRVEKYELITKEMCGIDSPILPHFLPVSTKCVTDERVRECYLTKYHFPDHSAEQRLSDYEKWEKDVKPVLEWINSKISDTTWEHPVWVSYM